MTSFYDVDIKWKICRYLLSRKSATRWQKYATIHKHSVRLDVELFRIHFCVIVCINAYQNIWEKLSKDNKVLWGTICHSRIEVLYTLRWWTIYFDIFNLYRKIKEEHISAILGDSRNWFSPSSTIPWANLISFNLKTSLCRQNVPFSSIVCSLIRYISVIPNCHRWFSPFAVVPRRVIERWAFEKNVYLQSHF